MLALGYFDQKTLKIFSGDDDFSKNFSTGLRGGKDKIYNQFGGSPPTHAFDNLLIGILIGILMGILIGILIGKLKI